MEMTRKEIPIKDFYSRVGNMQRPGAMDLWVTLAEKPLKCVSGRVCVSSVVA